MEIMSPFCFEVSWLADAPAAEASEEWFLLALETQQAGLLSLQATKGTYARQSWEASVLPTATLAEPAHGLARPSVWNGRSYLCMGTVARLVVYRYEETGHNREVTSRTMQVSMKSIALPTL